MHYKQTETNFCFLSVTQSLHFVVSDGLLPSRTTPFTIDHSWCNHVYISLVLRGMIVSKNNCRKLTISSYTMLR